MTYYGIVVGTLMHPVQCVKPYVSEILAVALRQENRKVVAVWRCAVPLTEPVAVGACGRRKLMGHFRVGADTVRFERCRV
jgi:hypothetical protein